VHKHYWDRRSGSTELTRDLDPEDVVQLDKAVYFAARDAVVHSKTGGSLSSWRLPLFALMFRNSIRAAEPFNLPAYNFIEMGRQIEI
jgi:K+ transporter